MKKLLAILILTLHCSTAQNKYRNVGHEVAAFENSLDLYGKALYLSPRLHPYEAAFLDNDILMLEHFYARAIDFEPKKYRGMLMSTDKTKHRWIKNNPLDPEHPVFDYKDKLMFAIFIEHAKNPACAESAAWLASKPLLLRMFIHHTTGTAYSFSESGSSTFTPEMNAKEKAARSTGNLIDQNEPYVYRGLPTALAQALIEQRAVQEDHRAKYLNDNPSAARSGDEQKWLDEYNNGKRLPKVIPVSAEIEPVVIKVKSKGRTAPSDYDPYRKPSGKATRSYSSW